MIAMTSFPNAFKALVIGSGAIGTAFIDILRATPHCSSVELLSRHSQPAIDFDQENSIADAAQALLLAKKGPFHLIVNAVGILHSSHFMPEKKRNMEPTRRLPHSRQLLMALRLEWMGLRYCRL